MQEKRFYRPFSLSPFFLVERTKSFERCTGATFTKSAQAAQRLPLPTLNSLPLAWKGDPGPQLAQGQQQLGDLRTAVFAVAPQFPRSNRDRCCRALLFQWTSEHSLSPFWLML